MKIYACTYWKEHCFALTSETIVDKAVELDYIGGTYGGMRKPTKFICLLLKMLQLQPEMEIVHAFIANKDYKYVRALGCFYLRLVAKPEEMYELLESLFIDFRKLRHRKADGTFEIIHIDEYVDELLRREVYFDIVLPRIPKREQLEAANVLKPWVSALEEDLEAMGLDEEIEGENQVEQDGSAIGAVN